MDDHPDYNNDKKHNKLMSSTMVDLKAELYRKKEEFKRQKDGTSYVKGRKSEKSAKKAGVWSKQNTGVAARAQRDLESREVDAQEEEILAKSRRILEQKSKVYDSFTNSSTIPEEDGSEYYLVDFQKKSIDALVEEREETRRREEEEELKASCPDDEWVDFVDSLGRDRRCMRRDVHQLMEKDRLIAMKGQDGKDNETAKTTVPAQLMSSDMHREKMRQKWESEAQDLLDKGQDQIHYSNVQYDEIRSHGVGFFQFSKDHTKREEEMEKLQKLREETKDERSRKDKIKEKRQAMMEARLAKVRQRRKLKEGPTETAKAEPKDSAAADDIGPKLSEAISAVRAEEKEREEKAAEEKRKTHVREWDQEKEKDPGWGSRNYVSARREERESDFAPPSIYFEDTHKSNKQHFANVSRQNSSFNTLVKKPSYRNQESEFAPPSIYFEVTDKSNKESLPNTSHQFNASVNKTSFKSKDNFGLPKLSSPEHNTQILSTTASIPLPPDKESNEHHHPVQSTNNNQGYPTSVGSHQPIPNQAENYLTGVAANTSSFVYQPQSEGQVNTFPDHDSVGNHPSPHMYTVNQSHTNTWGNEYVGHQHLNSQAPYWYANAGYGTGSSGQSGYEGIASINAPSTLSLNTKYTMPGVSAAASSGSSGGNVATSAASNNTGKKDKPKFNKNCKNSSKKPIHEGIDSNQPPPEKKPKVPKDFVLDMRWVNNFDTSSINPEPGRVPDVAGVPYTPGTFSKSRPHGKEVVVDQPDTGSSATSVSGGPLIYTQAQLDWQKKELERQETESSDMNSDEADKKVQDFLSSIRAGTK